MFIRPNIFIFIFTLFVTIQGLQAHPAWGIVVDKNRNIFFADIARKGRGAVWKLSNKGELTALLSDFHAHNVVLDRDGNLYSAHGEGHQALVRFDDDMKPVEIFRTDDHRKFNGGNWTCTADGEIIFHAENKLWKLQDGERIPFSDHHLEWSQILYAAPNGEVYATDIGTGNGTLYKFDKDGIAEKIIDQLISIPEKEKDKHNDILLGMTEGCDGFTYICELAGRQILKILDNGTKEQFYKSEADWYPAAIDFFSGEAHILLFHNNYRIGPRIVKIDEFGDQSVLFDYDSYKSNNEGLVPPILLTSEPILLWFVFILGLTLILIILKSGLKRQINLESRTFA